MHLRAGEAYGRDATCGLKVDYKREESAIRAAQAMTAKRTDGKRLEAYPCFFCAGWHVGREMTDEERARFAHGGVTGYADGDCKSPVSGSTPDIASMTEQERRELANEHRGEIDDSVPARSIKPRFFERPPGNVYELPDTPENRELLESIEDNRQHPERGKSRPTRK